MKQAPISRIRIVVQGGFALLCLFAGYRFYQFYGWASGQSPIYVAKPAIVEGFLPISALLGLKRFVMTGLWDEVHPAGLTIFIGALTLALFLRKAFCGWICPVGFVSNMTAKLGKILGLQHELPPWLDYPILCVKYLLLAFFCYIILWKMDVQMIEAFLYSQYNLVVDARMLLFFLHPSALTLKVLGVLFLASLVVRNFWCRYLCPYGALLGIGALIGPLQVKRNSSLCINCKRCEQVCPAAIHITRNRAIRHPECVGCVECVEVCPRRGCLALEAPTEKRIPIYAFPVAVVGVIGLFWTVAVLTGHWHAAVPLEAFRHMYPAASLVMHP